MFGVQTTLQDHRNREGEIDMIPIVVILILATALAVSVFINCLQHFYIKHQMGRMLDKLFKNKTLISKLQWEFATNPEITEERKQAYAQQLSKELKLY